MTESENLSRSFYHDLGADGLAQRTNPVSDAWTIASITNALPHRARVLDAGCGYGRIAVPLAAHGFSVVGVDLSPEMLREARSRAARAGVKVPCVLGSMAHLPYDNNSFDAVLCLWSAFNEILEEEEQFLALGSMWRVMAS